MKFIQFTVNTTSQASELVADIMWQYTTYGVAISDHKDVVELIENRRDTFDYMEDELLNEEQGAFVKAYVEIEEAKIVRSKIDKDLEELRHNSEGYIDVGTLETTAREIDGDDWIEIWRKHFRPIRYGKIVVCPKWINYEAADGEEIVYIDSNMAFGTGEHETTSMCIELLQKYVSEKDVVLDVGTGSGILGISSIKLGACRAVMTDIDKVAVLSAQHNAKLNGVDERCMIVRSDLLDGVSDVGDIAVANITAEILMRLTDSLSAQLKSGGILIMSGIIKSRLNAVIEKFVNCGFEHISTVDRGEWHAVVMRNIKA